MIVPVLRALKAYGHIKTQTLALTTGGVIFSQEQLPYKGYKDFLRPEDAQALQWGQKLAAIHYSPESGIDEAESVAYFGLSYYDLIVRHGEEEAAKLFAEKGRHAFLQLTVMERVLDEIRPDMVVTTNSPRSEQAAIEVARKRGITTLSMVDLFGVGHFYPLEADYITVLSERVIEYLEAEKSRPTTTYLITGNPAFDTAFDYRGPMDYNWRHEHFPLLADHNKVVLWIDAPAYWKLDENIIHWRTAEEIQADFSNLAQAAKENDAYLLIRPHPSQPRALFDEWMAKNAPAHVFFAGHVPLYPLLNIVDVVAAYTSTVMVEALLMQRDVLQLQYHSGKSDMPLYEWGLTLQVSSPEALSGRLSEALQDDGQASLRKTRANSFLPQEKAGPKVARYIYEILSAKS